MGIVTWLNATSLIAMTICGVAITAFILCVIDILSVLTKVVPNGTIGYKFRKTRSAFLYTFAVFGMLFLIGLPLAFNVG